MKDLGSHKDLVSNLTYKKKLLNKNLEDSALKIKKLQSYVIKQPETIAMCTLKNIDDRAGLQINEKSFALRLSSRTQDISLVGFVCS